MAKRLAALLLLTFALEAEDPSVVLVIINGRSAASRAIGEYYASKRGIPPKNRCVVQTADLEEIDRSTYDREIARPIAEYLRSHRLTEKVLFLVTTLGVPLKIQGSGGEHAERAAVDSELTLLYQDLKGKPHPLAGSLPNPMFGNWNTPFRHPQIPIYMVTRLAGYSVEDVRGMIDRSLVARNRGVVVLDLKSSADEPGNDWLRNAALFLPDDRVLLDETEKVIYGAKRVIGYASWGSNDPHRKQRKLGFDWLPGAVATEFVSTNGRTFRQPPESWALSSWKLTDRMKWWMGSPQSLTADLIHEGASGASGHVYEPYLAQTPRPDYLFPAYLGGRNLAESFYIAIPGLSWMNIVVGDPLTRLAP